MDTRYGANPEDCKNYDSEKLRGEFLVDSIFHSDEIGIVYSHYDRMIIGSAVPVSRALSLDGGKELASGYFLERREIGIINIGAPGKVTVDGTVYSLANKDGLYVGKGAKSVSFSSDSASSPASFYFNSCPAHATLPTEKVELGKTDFSKLGSPLESNARTIHRYFHEKGIQTCQLVMGMTLLEPGSLWNTMPSHTHDRRMEAYLYFDLPQNGVVFHLMGRPNETRHLVMRDRQVVISPPWSIHSGVGTQAYSFIWGMAGENKAFADMDPVAFEDFR